MRRGVGIGGLQKQAAAKETFREAGEAMASAQIEQLKGQLETFRRNLEGFAKRHQKEIGKNPLLRSHFQRMCTLIGVDPLVSSKGFWAEMLGVGDFYYELGIQVVESCLVLQEQTGGLNDFATIKRRIVRGRGSNAVDITDDDIVKAVATLRPLGSGYAIVDLGGAKAIQSVPLEMSPDGSWLLSEGQQRGYVSAEDCAKLAWQEERFRRAIASLVAEGLVWVDEQEPGGARRYWFPCFFRQFE